MPIIFLIASSFYFYNYWNPKYTIILVVSILANFAFGKIVSRYKNKLILGIFVAINLASIGYYKYFNFLVDNVNYVSGTSFNFEKIILPLGISFFTFQNIAYLVDIYRNDSEDVGFLDFSLFVSFFPPLIAGPIIHPKEIIPQFKGEKFAVFNWKNINTGLIVFAIGLFGKVVIADNFAPFANDVFKAASAGKDITLVNGWLGALAYTLQLYFDFCGYSCMALGSAYMLGITLPINFDSPYKSTSIIDFWRRWHMTLSQFLRDHVYIPLGGSRRGNRYFNLFLTMLIGGIWHGAAWTFVIWGALQGILLIINHFWRYLTSGIDNKFILLIIKNPVINTALTFFVTVISWVFFRATDLTSALAVLRGMFGFNELGTLPKNYVIFWTVCVLCVVFFLPNTQQLVSSLHKFQHNLKESRIKLNLNFSTALFISILLFFAIKFMFVTPDSEFLYFNF